MEALIAYWAEDIAVFILRIHKAVCPCINSTGVCHRTGGVEVDSLQHLGGTIGLTHHVAGDQIAVDNGANLAGLIGVIDGDGDLGHRVQAHGILGNLILELGDVGSGLDIERAAHLVDEVGFRSRLDDSGSQFLVDFGQTTFVTSLFRLKLLATHKCAKNSRQICKLPNGGAHLKAAVCKIEADIDDFTCLIVNSLCPGKFCILNVGRPVSIGIGGIIRTPSIQCTCAICFAILKPSCSYVRTESDRKSVV